MVPLLTQKLKEKGVEVPVPAGGGAPTLADVQAAAVGLRQQAEAKVTDGAG